ncbi:MAG: hypothetical protein P8J01_00815 [Acidimicrobiales bacterium]|jgi:hypothetical protein|nr:hypothetical protein [Acidimicrobiales bacterium]
MQRLLTVLIAMGVMAGAVGCFGGDQGEKDEAEAREWIVEYGLETYAFLMKDLALTSVSEYTWYDTCVLETQFIVSYDYVTEYSPYSPLEAEDMSKRQFRRMKEVVLGIGSVDPLYDPAGSGRLDKDWWTQGEGVRDDARRRGVIACSLDMLSAQEFARVSEEYGR